MNEEVSKFKTACSEEQMASFACVEKYPKKYCTEFFDKYRECRRKEKEAIFEERRNRGGKKYRPEL